jgi:hypothetical protein
MTTYFLYDTHVTIPTGKELPRYEVNGSAQLLVFLVN